MLINFPSNDKSDKLLTTIKLPKDKQRSTARYTRN